MDRTWTLGRRALVLLPAVVVAASLVMFAGGASASCNCVVANGKIAFVSDRGGDPDDHYQIYAMNPDGSDQTNLSNNPANDGHPDWSSGGKKIAFDRVVTCCHWDIYVMNADGSGQTRLTFGPGSSQDPTWSPSGQKIAFWHSGDNFGGDSEIFVMNADGSGQTDLTNTPERFDTHPAWSPDGTRIAFDGDCGLYVMNADGSGQTLLVAGPCGVQNAAWSPDSKKIAFGAGVTIDVMNADGSGKTPVVTWSGDCVAPNYPTWSPNGKKIAFASGAISPAGDCTQELYVINADGSGQTRLTFSSALHENVWPTWQRVLVAKPSSHLIPHTGVPDSIFKWKAGGFEPGEPVVLLFDGSRIGLEVADRAGGFEAEVRVPASAAPGKHALEAVGRWSDVTAKATFHVRKTPTRSP